MARIRTIKPGFFKNEDLAELPFPARLLFIGLWTQSDKEGRLEDRPKRLKVELFPYDSLDVNNLLERLQSAGFISRYEVGDLKVIQIKKFKDHQRITGSEADSESLLPEEKETTWKQQGNNLDDRKGMEGNKERKGKEDTEPEIVFPFNSEKFLNTWEIWKSYRKEIKKPIKTKISEQASLKKLSEDSGENELTAIRIIETSIANGWQGLFKIKEDGKQQTTNDKKTKWANHFAKRTGAGN